jgi:hypothetical protein
MSDALASASLLLRPYVSWASGIPVQEPRTANRERNETKIGASFVPLFLCSFVLLP